MDQFAKQVPYVDYLVLEDEPHLRVNTCRACNAHYFDRRNACAQCSSADFETTAVSPDGIVTSFTIVASPSGPYTSVNVDCDGITVKGTLINAEPDPASLRTGMPVRLTTYGVGFDADGVEAIGFAFEPSKAPIQSSTNEKDKQR